MKKNERFARPLKKPALCKKSTLGIEGGGTRTTWSLLNEKLEVIASGVEGPGNLDHLREHILLDLLRRIKAALPIEPDFIGLCMAGAHVDSQKRKVEEIARTLWPKAKRIIADGDIKSGYYAAHGKGDGILVIAGTGSNTIGRKGEMWDRAGGNGFILGDQGSGYHIAHRALRTAYTAYDATKKLTPLAQELLRFSGCNTLIDLVPVVYENGKDFVASFAKTVFERAEAGDRDAKQIIQESVKSLAEHVGHIQRRMKLKNPPVGLIGGMFKSPLYLKLFKQAVLKQFKPKEIFVVQTPGAVGAALFALDTSLPSHTSSSKNQNQLPDISALPTEKRNPRSMALHASNIDDLVHLFIDEEKFVQSALKQNSRPIIQACTLVAHALQKKGRLFYIGAGTSGRLGILDASEMPPTFGLSPDTIQAVIAGGAGAMFRAQEGAEDDPGAGAQSVRERGVTRADVVWGISTSGRTPFVLGALKEAQKRGAATILLTCNPLWKHPSLKPKVAIHLDVGPELISGSTRLKGGTVTKLVLNMASSIAMIQAGRVYENLMIHVMPTNEKLRARACRLVQTLADCNASTALEALRKKNWNIVPAVETLRVNPL